MMPSGRSSRDGASGQQGRSRRRPFHNGQRPTADGIRIATPLLTSDLRLLLQAKSILIHAAAGGGVTPRSVPALVAAHPGAAAHLLLALCEGLFIAHLLPLCFGAGDGRQRERQRDAAGVDQRLHEGLLWMNAIICDGSVKLPLVSANSCGADRPMRTSFWQKITRRSQKPTP